MACSVKSAQLCTGSGKGMTKSTKNKVKKIGKKKVCNTFKSERQQKRTKLFVEATDG